MQLTRWDTLLSDIPELYFYRLLERGKSWFEVTSGGGSLFTVDLEGVGPYLLLDEVNLGHYFALQSEGLGRTYLVQPSLLKRAVPGLLEPDRFKHYVIQTMDTCIEFLSETEPVIRLVP